VLSLNVRSLRPGMTSVTVEGVVSSKGEPRLVDTRYGPARVCTARLRGDDGGEINLSLWNEQIDLVEVGDRVRVENGYVSSYRGRLYLSSGRRGRLVKLE